jgi:hypothetical protein
MVFMRPFYLIIRFTTRPMTHGGFHRQVPRRWSFDTAPYVRGAPCNRDWLMKPSFADSNISEGNYIGEPRRSQRRQFLDDFEPRPATIDAANSHIDRLQATSRYSREVPSKQRVAGKNPAGRARSELLEFFSMSTGSQ